MRSFAVCAAQDDATDSSGPLRPEVAFELYQEILDAVESARATVLGEATPASWRR